MKYLFPLLVVLGSPLYAHPAAHGHTHGDATWGIVVCGLTVLAGVVLFRRKSLSDKEERA